MTLPFMFFSQQNLKKNKSKINRICCSIERVQTQNRIKGFIVIRHCKLPEKICLQYIFCIWEYRMIGGNGKDLLKLFGDEHVVWVSMPQDHYFWTFWTSVYKTFISHSTLFSLDYNACNGKAISEILFKWHWYFFAAFGLEIQFAPVLSVYMWRQKRNWRKKI